MIITFSVIQSWSLDEQFIALNAHQFRLLGLSYPPRKGWIQKLIGTEIPESTAMTISQLRGLTKKQRNSMLTSGGISPKNLFQQPLKGL